MSRPHPSLELDPGTADRLAALCAEGEVTLVARGQPIAAVVSLPRLARLENVEAGRPRIGAMRGEFRIVGDIDAPTGETWDSD